MALSRSLGGCRASRTVGPVAAACVAAAIALAVAPPASAADENDNEGGPQARSEYYETATVRARPLETATSSVSVIDRERIEELDVATVGELMRFVPGVSVTSSGPRGGFSTAQVRGGDPNFTVVLVDGVPLNDATDQFGGAVDLNALPTVFVERIEIVRGPVSTYYGSTGLAGVINVITRRGEAGRQVEWSAAAGTDSLLHGAVSVAGGDGRRSYFAGASWEEERARVADDSFEQLALNGSLDVATARDGRLRLTGRASTRDVDDYGEGSGGPLLGSGETRFSEHDELVLGAEWRGGTGARSHRLYGSVYRHEMDRESPAIFPVVPPVSESTRFTEARLGWNVALAAAERDRLVLGLEAVSERGENDSVLLLPPVAGGPIDGSYDLSRTTGALVAEWTASRDSLVVELGARVDAPEDFNATISPRFGISKTLRDGRHRVRLSAGRSFKLPSFYTLGSPPALGGNPDLDPEVSIGADLSFERVSADGAYSGRLTLFATRFDDLIDFDFDTFQLLNRSEVDSRGAELEARFAPSPSVELHVNVLWQRVENSETGETLRRRPEWSGGAQLVWRPSSRWRLAVDLSASSDQRDEQVPAPARDELAGYGLVGATAGLRVAPRWTARLAVHNLLDREYETLIGFPGPGRSARAALSFRSEP